MRVCLEGGSCGGPVQSKQIFTSPFAVLTSNRQQTNYNESRRVKSTCACPDKDGQNNKLESDWLVSLWLQIQALLCRMCVCLFMFVGGFEPSVFVYILLLDYGTVTTIPS